uniref:MYB binding protein (P160) 1a n=1 Tax=Tetraodon nigroviridis TaxID=99883 RepID=H3CQD1_TETNG
MVEMSVKTAGPPRPAGIPQQNRVFLDFFWDLAKPEQEVRLKAIEDLIQYLKTNNKADELEYTFKRLVDGLAHTREAARPGFSLALGQVLNAFEDVTLRSVLSRIKDKHDLQTVKKNLIRNALFGNYFGVLALQQSGRLSKEPQVLLGCVQLLQNLSQHRQHLRDLPSKTMMDILNEISEEVFEEVLLSALQADLAAAFRTPEQLQLLLVALQRFPHTLKPKKLKKLLGSSTIINADNTPKLTELLKTAAQSSKKDRVLPAVALDLLKLSLKEDSFQLFWNNTIVSGMLAGKPGPSYYLSFRLLGSALPHLSLPQLKEVLSGEVMLQYGMHVVSAQKPDRFKLAPEMDAYVSDFLQGCQDPDKQLAVVVGFSSLTNQGYPVVPSAWRVVQHLQPDALRQYVAWLKKMFLQPQEDQLLDFSTHKQQDNQDGPEPWWENSIFRLRKWLATRLSSIIDSNQAKRQEDLIMDVARFVFFHAFFTSKKRPSDVPEADAELSVPLDDRTRGVLVNSFFGLLLSMHHLPPAEGAPGGSRRVLGVTADGTMWIYHLVQYAQALLEQPKHVQCCRPLGPEQQQAWDSVLESVASLRKKAKKASTAENTAFQQLFLLVGLHLFKAPEELLDIVKDLQSCVDKAQEKKAKKKKKQTEEEEPEWVEVMVDILLSLLSRPSRHIRQVCRTVFASICADVTPAALAAILDVLDPEQDDEESSAVVVTDDNGTLGKGEEDEEMEVGFHVRFRLLRECTSVAVQVDDSDTSVDQNFRLELMKVLQQRNALATEGDGSSDEDLDDEAMMQLDKSLAAVFLEQKKKTQAKKDEKTKIQKERTLVRDFKIKVLDLVEVFVGRQAGSPLVLSLLEPLLNVIQRGMSSDSHQQEQDFLRRAADIFKNQLCRSKVYCRTVGDRQGELHDLLDKLMHKAQKLPDSSVSLYYFSACLYVVKVLRGAPPAGSQEDPPASECLPTQWKIPGSLDVDRVTGVFREALNSFMGRRKSPLTTQMFTDLFNRFPALCVNLLDAAVQHIRSGVRVHQQGQACVLVLRAMQSREVQQLLDGTPWTDLCAKVAAQLAEGLQQVEQADNKLVKEKVVKMLELCQFLVKRVHQQKLSVDLEPLRTALQTLPNAVAFGKTGKLEDTYWAVMKHFGVPKPKVEKTKPNKEAEQQQQGQKKKKGFLPETKKRQKRQKPLLEPAGEQPTSAEEPGAEKGRAGTKKDKERKRKQAAGEASDAQPASAKKRKQPAQKSPTGNPGKKKKKPKQRK